MSSKLLLDTDPPVGVPSRITTQDATGSGTNSASATYAATPTPGNLLVAVTCEASGSSFALTNTGWTQVVSNSGGSTTWMKLYYKVAGVGEPTTVTTTVAGTSTIEIAIYEYTGFTGTPTVDTWVSVSNGSSLAASVGPTSETTSPNELIFAAVQMGGSVTNTVSSWSGGFNTRDSVAGRLFTADQIATSRSTFSTTLTTTGTANVNVATIVAFTGSSVAPTTGDALLLEDGTSHLLLENDVQLRQSVAYVGTASQTNMTFTLPNAPVVGNLLIATIMYWTGDNPFLTPSGWTLQGTVQESGQTGIATIYRVVVGGDTASWNLTVLSSADQNSGYMWEIMGQHATVATAFNQLSVTHATSAVTSINSASITPTVLNTLVLSATMTMGSASTDVATYSAGWSERKFINSTFQPAWAYQMNGYTTDTTTPISYTVSNLPSAQQATVIMAIAPATVGGTVLTTNQPATARIAVNKTLAQPSVARIANTKTKTQPAISRISNTKTLTQPVIARIARNVTKTQTATARITNTGLVKTQGAIARIATTRALTQTSTARISQNYTKTQAATARIGNAYIAALASYWKFDDASGSTATDAIGGNNGTWQGTLGSQWGTGKLSGDGVFNGTDNYVAVGDKANLSFNTGNYTLSVWLKTTATSRQTALHKYQYTGTSVESGYYIDMLAGGNLRAVYETTNANLRNTDSSITINDGNWHLVTVIRPSTTGDILLYIDGVLDPSVTHAFNAGTPGSIDNTIPFAIGQSFATSIGINNWNGQIDEVGVWSRALSGTEVSNLYNLNIGLSYPFTAAASVITKTQPAIARIARNLTKTQTGISRIANTRTLTQPAISRVAKNLTLTQPATASILQNLTPTKTQPAIARIATNRNLTQGAVGRIATNRSKTQPGVSRISNTRTAPQTATARVAKNISKTQPAVARIRQTVGYDQQGRARIANNFDYNLEANARISQNYTKTQPSIARVARNLTKTQSATANIITNTTVAKTQGATARIATNRALTQTAVSRISQTYTRTQSGIARVANTRTKTQPATARVVTSVTKTQPAIARIANSRTKTQPAISRISQVLTKTQPVIARVATVRTLTQSATAKITINGSILTKTQPATAKIAVNRSLTQGGIARLANSRNLTQPAVSRISRNFTKTQAATGRISQTFAKTQTATANITAILTRTKVQTAVSRIANQRSVTQSATARILHYDTTITPDVPSTASTWIPDTNGSTTFTPESPPSGAVWTAASIGTGTVTPDNPVVPATWTAEG